ncbi:MAG: 16S rRNA (cytosine(1402)-N(4))-methyltransferase RsmH [Verrucomicrobiota bacterium]
MSLFSHQPVLLDEVVTALQPKAHGRYLDGTLGGGGHAAAILGGSSPDGFLIGCDRDPAALAAAQERLGTFVGRFETHHCDFKDADRWVAPGSLDGIVLDLGVSSHQLDTPGRGFSFQSDGPLDMRMDPSSGDPTAADLVNGLPAEALADLFWKWGEERQSRRIARAIAEERRQRPFTTTRQLADFIERICPRRGSPTHPATRCFQALRIATNGELDSVEEGLERAFPLLAPGGRLAVISFHSLEDRLVKDFMRRESRDYEFEGPVDHPHLRRPRTPRGKELARRGIVASDAEVQANPRARSARLRVLERMPRS